VDSTIDLPHRVAEAFQEWLACRVVAEVVRFLRVGRKVVELLAAVSLADVDLSPIGQGSRRRGPGERLALVIDDLGQDEVVRLV
jgi:hypothetical protein